MSKPWLMLPMFTAELAVWMFVPSEPWAVMVLTPTAWLYGTVTFTVEVPEVVTEDGVNPTVTPDGVLTLVRATVPV